VTILVFTPKYYGRTNFFRHQELTIAIPVKIVFGGGKFFSNSAPRRSSPWGHWHHRNVIVFFCSGFCGCQLHRWDHLLGVFDTAEIISVVSLIPRKFIVYQISRRIRSHIRYGFDWLLRNLGGFKWWKKPRVKNLVIVKNQMKKEFQLSTCV
jgi:hypothetical protein